MRNLSDDPVVRLVVDGYFELVFTEHGSVVLVPIKRQIVSFLPNPIRVRVQIRDHVKRGTETRRHGRHRIRVEVVVGLSDPIDGLPNSVRVEIMRTGYNKN